MLVFKNYVLQQYMLFNYYQFMSITMTTKTFVMMFGVIAVAIAGMALTPMLIQQEAVGALFCPPSCDGGPLRDIIIGSSAGNTINGNGGNDNLYGYAGADTLNGGDGDDNLYHNSSAKGSDGAADHSDGGNGYDRCHTLNSDGDTYANCESVLQW